MKIELIATEVDKSGNSIEIKKCDSISHKPIYTFFLRSMAETIDSGFGIPVTSWSDNECEAIYAEVNNKIIGLIVYSKLDKRTIFVILASVDKEFRTQGIFSILYKNLELIAKSQKYNAISSLVHRNNFILNECLKNSIKRIPEYHFYAKRL